MLPPDVKSLVELVKANPEASGAFSALLVLLENSSDSGVIAAALTEIRPSMVADEDQRARAANLLKDADAHALSAAWTPGASEPDHASNVVTLRPGTGGLAEQLGYGQRIGFDDIGGLEKVKDQVRRKIIRPFENPALFQKFRRKAGGGVLLYGPPGCGKTMIGRAVATEVSAQFMEIKAADILDRYIGVAEARIADAFAEARANKPAVLFFDEVEALAQRRQFDSTRSVNTVVSALLTEMDSFDARNEGILLLGATNLPWSLDSAFRRPGRFDRTLFVPPPDKVARAFILKRLLADRPVSKSLDVEKIVFSTSGFSGADLAALVETAVDYAIDTSFGSEDTALITNDHFVKAFEEVRASTGEWLAEARNFADYANQGGVYDELKDFFRGK